MLQLSKNFGSMAERSRYSITAKIAGVEGGILKNKLSIKDQVMLDDAETLLLVDAYTHFFGRLKEEGLDFNLPLLFEIHKYFLGTLYSWAGKIRRIDISKDDILFAPAEYLQNSLTEFERLLYKHIPTATDPKTTIAEKLAFIHNELNALHPFREGNGRTIRLFLDLLAVQSGYRPIDWKRVPDKMYIDACKLGMRKEHSAMKKIIFKGLSR